MSKQSIAAGRGIYLKDLPQFGEMIKLYDVGSIFHALQFTYDVSFSLKQIFFRTFTFYTLTDSRVSIC